MTSSLRLICSGGRTPHTVRELALLLERGGRPDMAAAALQSGLPDLAADFLKFEPGWEAAGGSVTQVGPDGSKMVHTRARVAVVPARDGADWIVHVPECPDCGRRPGPRRLTKLQQAAEQLRRDDVDVSLFVAIP